VCVTVLQMKTYSRITQMKQAYSFQNVFHIFTSLHLEKKFLVYNYVDCRFVLILILTKLQ
jgi:hypothetical protein